MVGDTPEGLFPIVDEADADRGDECRQDQHEDEHDIPENFELVLRVEGEESLPLLPWRDEQLRDILFVCSEFSVLGGATESAESDDYEYSFSYSPKV